MITQIYEMVCDGECSDCITGDLNESLDTLRERADKEGWKRIDGKDYCPECAEKVRGAK